MHRARLSSSVAHGHSGEGGAGGGGGEGGGGGGAGGKGGDGGNEKSRNIFLMAQEKIEDSQAELLICKYRYVQRRFDTYGVRMHDPNLTDRKLFRQIRSLYNFRLRGWRAYFSFKALKGARLLELGKGVICEAQENDILFSSGFMAILSETSNDPDPFLTSTSDEWIRWFYNSKDMRVGTTLAIEMQESYDPTRITIMAGILLTLVLGLTAAWLIEDGDPGYVSTVMSYALAFVAAGVALGGLWDWFDGGEAEQARLNAVLQDREAWWHLQMVARKPPWHDAVHREKHRKKHSAQNDDQKRRDR